MFLYQVLPRGAVSNLSKLRLVLIRLCCGPLLLLVPLRLPIDVASMDLCYNEHDEKCWRVLRCRRHNWDSVAKQLDSVKVLLTQEWLHLFPGHGRQYHFANPAERLAKVNELLAAEGASVVE